MAKIIGTAGNDNLNGTSQADEIYGRGGRDTLRGGGSADKLYGEGEDDTLFGDAGNDLLTGGAGRDTIDGGTETDTAFYSGLRSDYSISTRNGVTTIRDLRGGSPDGTDTLTNVERIEFSDGSIFYLVANRAPSLASETWSVLEDGTHASAASLLANDVDLDGDELELVSVNGTVLLKGTATITLQSGARLTVANTGNYTFETRGVYNHLAEGETATEVITYQVADQFGGLSTATLTVVINGTNDAPVLYAAVSPGLNVTERPNHTTQVNDGSVTTSGTIAFDDVDLSDGHTVAVELLSATDSDSGPIAGLGSFIPQITNPSTGDGHGAVTWNFAVGNHLIDHLAQGQVITQTYRVTVTDDHGAFFTHDITITITGTNDVPVAAADAGAALEAGIGAGSNATGNVLANDSDVDQGTVLVVSGINLGGAVGTVGSPLQGSYGRLTINADGSYTYVVDQSNVAVQALGAASDTLSETFTYQVADGDGGTATANLTITISGQNDAPDVFADVGTAVEAGTAAGSDASGNVLGNDRDVDAGDSLEVYAIEAVYAGATFFRVGDTYQSRYGTFTINADGSYSYVVDNDDPAVQSLQVGETLTEQFFYNARDDDGWARAAFLTITIHGANDAPAAAVDAAAGNEDSLITGSVAPNDSDVDNGALLSYSLVGTAPAGLTFNPNGSWSLDASNSAYQHIAAGAIQDVIVNYTVTDEHGASGTASLTISVHGVNDSPAAVDEFGFAFNAGEDHAGLTQFPVLFNDSDPDDGASLTITAIDTTSLKGNMQIWGGGTSLLYTPNPAAFQYLALGEAAYETVTYTVSDEHGATDTATMTIRIDGKNDVPVGGDDAAAGNEDSLISGSVAPNDSDVDNGALLSYSLVGTAPAGLTFNPDGSWSLDASDSAYQHIAAGAIQDVIVNYTVTDEHGASDSATLTVTVTGTADNAPPDAVDDMLGGAGLTDRVGGEFRVNSYTTSNQLNPSLAGLVGGGFVVTWHSDGQDGSGLGFYGQLYDSLGSPIGSEFSINTYTALDQGFGSVAALADGGFLATWNSSGQDGSSLGVYGQRYDAAGNPVETEFRINTYVTSYQSDPSVASLSNGGFVVTWHSGGQDGSEDGIYGQRFDASGNPTGPEFRVNSYVTSDQTDSCAVGLPNGGFIVAWASYLQDGSGDGVYAQRYDATGAPVGIEFRVNSYTLGLQSNPQIAALSNGDVVITWTSWNGQDGSQGGIFAQRYNAQGDAIGTEFRVNSYTIESQYVPAIAALADGGFVISWTSSQDGSGGGIFAQRYDSAGLPAGTEFQIDTPANSTSGSRIAVLADGGFVVAWNSFGQDGSGTGVYAQIFSDGSLTSEDSIATISSANLLANDIDPDGDPLTIAAVSTSSNLGAAVTLNGDGTISYDPTSVLDYLAAGQTVEDSFSYTVSDGNGGSDIATVTLIVQGTDDESVSYQHVTLANLGGQVEIDLDSGTLSTDSSEADLGFATVVGTGPYTPLFYATGDGLWMAHLDGVDIDTLTSGDIASADFVFIPGTDDTWFAFESYIGDLSQPLDANDTLILVTSAGGAFALGNFEGVGNLPTHQEGQFDMMLLGPAADVYPTETFGFFGF